MVSLLLANAINASGFTLGKYLLALMSPTVLTGIRLLLSGVILLIFEYIYMPFRKRFHMQDMAQFFIVAFFGLAVSMSMGAWGLRYATSANASFFYNLSPFINAIFSYFYFNELISAKKMIGLTVGFLGFVPVFLLPEGGPHFGGISEADIALIIAVITNCWGLIVIRKLIVMHGYSAFSVNSICMSIGGMCTILIGFLLNDFRLYGSLAPQDYIFFFLLTLTSVVSNTLTALALKKFTATFVSFVAFSMPLFTAFYGWLFLGEHIATSFYISSVAVFVGLYIFYQEELKRGYTVER